MRVLLINRNSQVAGGADRVFVNTHELLAGAGEDWHVATFSREDVGLSGDADPRRLGFLAKLWAVKDYLYNRKVRRALEAKIREFRPDVAHVHLLWGTLSASVMAALQSAGVPTVMTVHDYRLICPANAMLDRRGRVCEKCRGSAFHRSLTSRCAEGNVFFSGVIMLDAYVRKYVFKPLEIIEHFIFVSQFARRKFIEFEPRYAARSSHQYNMCTSWAAPRPGKGGYFLYAGRLSREKGVLTLVAAAQATGIPLVIAGSGPQSGEVARAIEAMPAGSAGAGHIRLVGHQTGEKLRRLVEECSFVVVPSEWHENNPMAIVEAFAFGKPVIGADIGGIPELVSPDTGFLFNSGDVESLKAALREASVLPPDEYARMSSSSYEFARANFSPSSHLAYLRGVYERAVATRG